MTEVSRVPRYIAIAEELRGMVAGLSPGARLPSEAELCERFGVSRMTARHAVDQLVSDRLVERRRGAGTFVSAPRIHRLLGSPLSFSEAMRVKGLTVGSQVVERGPVTPTQDERRALQLAPGEGAEVLERLRLADGVPMAVERVVMSERLARHLSDEVEHGSLHAEFHRLGRHPSRSFSEVSAQRVSARHRPLLGLSSSGIVLCERRTIWDQNGEPLECTVTSYASERYSFEALLLTDTETRRLEERL